MLPSVRASTLRAVAGMRAGFSARLRPSIRSQHTSRCTHWRVRRDRTQELSRNFSTTAGSNLVQTSMEDGIAILKLSSPPMNALTTELMTELTATLKALEGTVVPGQADPSSTIIDSAVTAAGKTATPGAAPAPQAKAIIITAHESIPVFSAGLDITAMYQPKRDGFEAFWRSAQDLFLALYAHRLPTVAAINGSAPAGGCWLSTCADYRIMVDKDPKEKEPVIGMNETLLGIVAPPWFAGPVVAAVGPRQGDRMLQLGSLVTASRALMLGLVDEVVPRDQLMQAAARAAKEWASVPADGRYANKMGMRHRVELLGLLDSEAKRSADAERTYSVLSQPHVQAGLGSYLHSLRARKAQK